MALPRFKSVAGVTIPDTSLCNAAVDLLESSSPEFLCTHCFRTYIFGRNCAAAILPILLRRSSYWMTRGIAGRRLHKQRRHTGNGGVSELLAPDLAWRLVRPAMKCAPEICSIAEAQCESDFLIRKFCRAEIFQGDLRSKLIQQAPKGEALLLELTSQGAFVYVKGLCHGRKSWGIGDVADQQRTDRSGSANSQFEIVKQVVTQGDDRWIGGLVTKARDFIKPC